MSVESTVHPVPEVTALRWWQQLRWRLAIYFVLLVAVPMVVMSVFFMQRSITETRNQALAKLELMAELKQQEIDRRLSDASSGLTLLAAGNTRRDHLVRIATDQDPTGQNLRDLDQMFHQALEEYPGYTEVFFYNTQGLVLSGSDTTNVGKVVSRQPYFEASLVGPNLQTPYYEMGTNALTIMVTRPIMDANNTLVGVLAGRFNIDALSQILAERTGLGDTGETYLVSKQSNYLLTASRFEGYELTHAYNSLGIDRALAGENGSGTYKDYRNVTVYGVYRWIPSLQTALLAEQDEAEALQPFTDARNVFIAFTMLAALLAAGIGVFLATRMSEPLTALTQVAARISRGELDARAPAGQIGEVGILAATFNATAAQLQNMVQSLEGSVASRTRDLFLTLEVGQLATQTYLQTELLPRVTNFIREQFGLYYVQVYLLDDAKRYAVLASGTGEVGQELLARSHRLDMHQPAIVTRAAQSERPVLVSDTQLSDIHRPNPLLPHTRSEVAIPLIVGDEVLGVLDMQAQEAETFREDNLPVFEAMASQIASALRSAQAYSETQVAVQRAIEVNRRLTSASWISYLGRVGQGGQVGYEYDLQEVHPIEEPLPDVAEQPGNGHSRHVRRSVVLGEQPIGALVVGEDNDREWTREELDLIEDVADRVAQAVEQFRAFDETAAALGDMEEQAKRLAELNRMASEMSAAHDMTTVYRIVATRTNNILRSDRSSIALLLPESDTFELFGLDGERGSIPLGTRLPLEGTWVGHIAGSGLPGLLGDMRGVDYPETRQLSEQGLLSSMNVPLMAGDEVIGTLNVASTRLNAFRNNDLNMLNQIGSLLVSHMQNQRLMELTERRAAELQTVAEVGTAAAASLNPAELLANVANQTKERFGLYHVHIYLLDDTGQDLLLSAGAGEVGRQMVKAGHHIPLTREASLVARAARSRHAVVVNDVTAAADFLPNPLLPRTASEMAVPLIVGERVIGVLDVQSDIRGRFSDQDIAVQTTLASQIAVSVENARLFTESIAAEESIRKRATELQTVAEVGTEAASSLDPNQLLTNVTNLTKERFGLYHAHIYLLDEAGRTLRLAAGAGQVGEQMAGAGHRIPLTRETSIVANAARSGETLVVNDVTQVPFFLPNPMLPRTRSEMAIPLIIGDRVTGVLDVQSDIIDRFTDEDKAVMGILASQIAVSVDNARLFADQVQVTERLREVDRLKSEFLASMSHELRTPLNSIIGYAEVLLDGIDGDLTDDMEEDVGAIHGSGKHLLNLINDILDLAKIEAGQMDLVPEPIELRPVIDDAVNTVRVLVKDKPVQFVIEAEDNLPQVNADALRLRQVINNLLTNATKFTEKGDITLGVRRSADDPTMVLISVSDTGIGITPEKLPVIFDRFRQVDQSHTRRAGGTGLGLAITRQLVEMHGGDIWVESDPGHGSTFFFTLPIVVEPAAAEA